MCFEDFWPPKQAWQSRNLKRFEILQNLVDLYALHAAFLCVFSALHHVFSWSHFLSWHPNIFWLRFFALGKGASLFFLGVWDAGVGFWLDRGLHSDRTRSSLSCHQKFWQGQKRRKELGPFKASSVTFALSTPILAVRAPPLLTQVVMNTRWQAVIPSPLYDIFCWGDRVLPG